MDYNLRQADKYSWIASFNLQKEDRDDNYITALTRTAADNYLRSGMPLHARACLMAIGEERITLFGTPVIMTVG